MRQCFLPGLAPFLLLTACQPKPVEGVSDARVTLPAVAGRPGAAYFTLNGGEAENSLIEMSSPQVVRVELHETGMKDGMMTMSPIESGVAVPAGAKVAFEPGGKHAMLFDIAPSVKAGGTLTLTFSYASGRKIEVAAAVKAAGDSGGHVH